MVANSSFYNYPFLIMFLKQQTTKMQPVFCFYAALGSLKDLAARLLKSSC